MTARLGIILLLFLAHSEAPAQQTYLQGSVEEFTIADSDIALERLARPDTYFDKTGRRFAILGTESGSFEAWAFPLKLFRDFSFEFFIGSSTVPIPARDIVHRIEVRPAATTITYVFESFTIEAHFVTAVREPGAVILLDLKLPG